MYNNNQVKQSLAESIYICNHVNIATATCKPCYLFQTLTSAPTILTIVTRTRFVLICRAVSGANVHQDIEEMVWIVTVGCFIITVMPNYRSCHLCASFCCLRINSTPFYL